METGGQGRPPLRTVVDDADGFAFGAGEGAGFAEGHAGLDV